MDVSEAEIGWPEVSTNNVVQIDASQVLMLNFFVMFEIVIGNFVNPRF